jgi:hypothetical protein
LGRCREEAHKVHPQTEQDRADLIRLTAIIELLIPTAERIDGALVEEQLMADLVELRERAHSALRSLSER